VHRFAAAATTVVVVIVIVVDLMGIKLRRRGIFQCHNILARIRSTSADRSKQNDGSQKNKHLELKSTVLEKLNSKVHGL
jgi:hypothetical protein